MGEDELVHELVNSLAFEIEALPADNIIKLTSTNGTPLNVKVRVRNKDEPRLVQRGIVSVPKLHKHIASVDKIRLISSDQTILSFNVYMETELDKPSPPKNRKQGFKFFKLGGCLGTSYDEDEGPYLPGPSSKKGLRSRNSSKSDRHIHTENTEVAQKLKLNLEASNTRDHKILFGKCKPGGCLDPPFGEDKEPYRPPSPQAYIKPISKVKDSTQDQNANAIDPGKSSKASTKSFRKESNRDVIEPKPLLDIYARPVSLKPSSTSNYSNTIRRLSKISSSKILDAGKKSNKTYDDDSLRQSYQFPETYFIPPRDVLQHKEEERRYSRERSNDQIRPTTTRRENNQQPKNISDVFDEPNKIYPDNLDAKYPQSTKLSKQKGKDNTERIKQTLTDLTSYEIDKASKASENYRKNSKIHLNVPLVAQQIETTSSYNSTPAVDVTHIEHFDDFEIPLTSEDLDLSIISKCETDESNRPKEKYEKYCEIHHESVTQTRNKETTEFSLRDPPISDKTYEPENKLTESNEAKKPEKNITAKPELHISEGLKIISNSMSDQEKVKIVQSMSSSDTRKFPESDHVTYGFNGTFEGKATKTSNKVKEATDSQLSQNLANEQIKLLTTVRLPSLENVLDGDVLNEKNNITPEAQINHYQENKIKDRNLHSDAAKSVDDIQNISNEETFQEQTNESQDSKVNESINDDLNLLVGSGVDTDKINQSIGTELSKNQNTDSDVLVTEANQNKINKYLRTDITPHQQVQNKKNISKFESNMVQNDTNDDERKSLQDLNLKIIISEKINSLEDAETQDKSKEEKLQNLELRDTPSEIQVKDELQTNTDSTSHRNEMQNTASSESLHRHLLDEQYRKTNENENKHLMPNSMAKTDVKTNTNISTKINKNIDNIPDLNNVVLDDGEDFNTVEIIKINNDTHTPLENLEKNVKQVHDSAYKKEKESDNKTANFVNDLDIKKQHLTISPVNSDDIKRQPIDINVINDKKSPAQDLFIDDILDNDAEFSLSPTNSLETHNINDYDDKKAPLNVNYTDNDNVIITNSSLHDRNKNFTLDSQDTIPSAILHKPPLARAEEADHRNDDINVIKPFKRNTFTIVGSNTSLEKQEEPISMQQTKHITNEQFKPKKDDNIASNDQIETGESERLNQNNQQNNNEFLVDSKQETIKTAYFFNTSTQSDTSSKTDRSRESHVKSEANQNKYSESPENQISDSIKSLSNTISDNELRTNSNEESNLALKDLNHVDVVNNEIPKIQGQTDNEMYDKEKLILKNIPDDLIKQIAELQVKPDNNFEHLQTEATIYNPKNLADSDFNENVSDTIIDNAIKQITHLHSREYINEVVPMTEFSNDLEKGALEEKMSTMGDDEIEPKLLKNSEGENNHKKEWLRNTPDKISQSIVGGESNEYISEKNYGKIVHKNADLDIESIHTKDQKASMVDLNAVENINKVIIKKSVTPEDYTIRYNIGNETDTGNFDEISNLQTMESFSNKNMNENSLDSKNDAKYRSEYDKDNKINGDGDLKNMLELFLVQSIKKSIDTASIVSKDGTKYYSEYNSPIKISTNNDLRKLSEQVSVKNLNEVIDEKPAMAKYDVVYNIEHDTVSKTDLENDDVLEQQFDYHESFNKVVTEKLFSSKGGIGYSNESALLSKEPITVDRLTFTEVRPKKHLDINQNTEQYESSVIGQEFAIESKDKVYNQNDNLLNKTDQRGRISNPIRKTNSEVLFLNLALQSYVDNKNHTVVQTVSPLVQPVRYTDHNITMLQSLIRHGQEIRIPVDTANDLSLKFTMKTQQIPQNFSAVQSSSKKGQITRNISEHAHQHPENINKSLAFIYERELIPLHNVIKNLTEEINILTTQQELLKDKVRGAKRTKSLRLIPVNKRCGCGRM